MEKAVLKTLIYSDIFDYPLTIFEIHKWLIGPPAGRADRKVNLRQVESAIGRLRGKYQVLSIKGYYCLSKRKSLVKKRIERERYSKIYFRKAYLISQLLKLIPWIRLVGISGGLAMDNAGRDDDIDLVIITDKNRMWICRLITLGILGITGQRRKASGSKKSSAGKICCNLILEQDCLEQKNKNLYSAHEVLQMKVLWQRGNTYHQFLSANEWAFNFLPNWVGSDSSRQPRLLVRERRPAADASDTLAGARLGFTTFGGRLLPSIDYLENIAKNFQLKVMKKPQGQERIEEGALYFHPLDYGQQVLEKYRQAVKNLSTS